MSAGTQHAALAPRMALPLPRELRDQIYGYLLNHEYTRDAPWSTRSSSRQGSYSIKAKRHQSIANTYRFHLSILCTNKQISNEAAQILADNHFVVVSFNWEDLETLKHAFDVPIVTENQTDVARFRLHHMRLHVPSSFPKTHSFVTVGKDLPRFTIFLQWMLLHKPWPSYVMTNAHSTPGSGITTPTLVAPAPKSKTQSLKARFSSSHAKPLAPAVLSELLEPLEFVMAQIHVETIPDSSPSTFASIEPRFKIRHPPHYVSLKVMAFRMVEIAKGFKAAGDTLVAARDYEGAATRYLHIIDKWDSSGVFQQPQSACCSDAEPFILYAMHIMMDAAVSAGLLFLSLQKCHSALSCYQTFTGLWQYYVTLPAAKTTLLHTCSGLTCRQGAVWLRTILELLFDGMSDDTLILFQQSVQIMNETADNDTRARINHDLDIVNRWPCPQDTHCLFEIPPYVRVQKLSVYSFDPLIYSTPPPEGYIEPTGITAFSDRILCNELEKWLHDPTTVGSSSVEVD